MMAAQRGINPHFLWITMWVSARPQGAAGVAQRAFLYCAKFEQSRA
jgi:hypothetical protein